MPKQAAPVKPTLPLGVYVSRERYSAVAFKHSNGGVWYLTIITGRVTCEYCSEDRFAHDFPLTLPDYPMLRAVRLYDSSHLLREPQVDKILRTLLRM